MAVFIAQVVVIIGILMVTGVNFLMIYAIEKNTGTGAYTQDEMIATLVITFVIVACCLSQFDEAIIATLQCMAVDEEINNGFVKFGSPSFHEKLKSLDMAYESEMQKVENQEETGLI